MTTEAITTGAFAVAPTTAAGSPDHVPAGPAQESRSFGSQAVVDTFSRPAARMGAVWIGVLVLGAVFAPFIANSQPIFVRTAAGWSSPLIRNLTASDVTLFGTFLAAVGFAISRVRFLTALGWSFWLLAILVPMTNWPAVRAGWRPAGEFSPRLGLALLVGIALLDLFVLFAVPYRSAASRRFKYAMGAAAIGVSAILVIHPVNPPENVVWNQWRTLEAEGQLRSVLRTVVPYSPSDYLRDNPEARLQPPSRQHWMGTEASGADVFSRMLHATRIALSIGFIATGISVTIGILIGGLMGFFAGKVDILGMRLIEIFEALPALVLLITFCAFFGRNLYLMMAIIGFLSWTGDARFIRGEFFRLRKQDFVQAAIASGLKQRSVIFRHMLPNGITPVLISSSFGVANAILLESTLSFLGLGLVEEPSWGQLLNQARAGGTGFIWWMAIYPGLAIFLTVFAYNLIGEAIRDALDPRLQKRN